MSNKAKKIINLLWPPFCIGCKRNTEKFDSQLHSYLCPQCLEKLSKKNISGCAICEQQKGVKYNLCPQCSAKLELEGIIQGGSYQNPILEEAIHCFKYKGVKDLSFTLAALLSQNLKRFFKKRKTERKYESLLDWALVPVPLTKLKQRKRGCNQAEIIAQRLKEVFAIPLKTGIIKKVRHTKPQMEIKNSQQRKENLQGAFSLNTKKPRNLNARKIILVDDVATTGTTLNECAKTLKPFVKEIWGAVIAT